MAQGGCCVPGLPCALSSRPQGPHGPKTLCNACGLRWAKRTRKTEPDIGAHVQNSNGQVDGDLDPERTSLGLVNGQLMF